MYLLFERLTHSPPEHSLAELKQAVHQQIQRILTTCVESHSDSALDITNQGLPSVSSMARGSMHQMEFWSLRLRDLIREFEPRINLFSVSIKPTGNVYEPLMLVVEGELQCGEFADTMRFNYALKN